MIYAIKTTIHFNGLSRYTRAASFEDAIFQKGIENSVMKDSWSEGEFTIEIVRVDDDFDFENHHDFNFN